MEEDNLSIAISAVKGLLIGLLTQDKFCNARRVGKALEELLSLKNQDEGRIMPTVSEERERPR